MKTFTKLLTAAVVGGVMLSSTVSAATITKTGSNGGTATKSATHTPGSTTATVNKTGPNGATASKTYTHTAGSGGSFSATRTGVNGTSKTRSGSSTVTTTPATTTP